MEASKALGLAGFIFVAALGYLAYLAYDLNIYAVQDIFKGSAKQEIKVIIGVAIGVGLLFLAIPGLILLWMSEVGHELERNTSHSHKTHKAIDELKSEIQKLNAQLQKLNSPNT